jgi:hypothetical protein
MRSVSTVASLAFATTLVPRPAEAAPVLEHDPIFAAIEDYLKAEAESARLQDAEDKRPAARGQSAEMRAASDEVVAARLRLAQTAPTTLTGLAAYGRFLDHQSSVVFGEGFFDDQMNDKAEPLAFFASLNRSLGSLLRLSGELGGDGDAELLRLGVSLDVAIAAAEIARRDLNAAEAEYDTRKPVRSDSLLWRDGDRFFAMHFCLVDGYYMAGDVEALRQQQARGWRGHFPPASSALGKKLNAEDWPRRARERAAEIIGAWDEWIAAMEELALTLGTARLDAKYDARILELDLLWKRTANIRATTIAGLAVKARVAQFHRRRSGAPQAEDFADDGHEIGCNICDDLAELTADNRRECFAGASATA